MTVYIKSINILVKGLYNFFVEPFLKISTTIIQVIDMSYINDYKIIEPKDEEL
jgi:hypothetical protein